MSPTSSPFDRVTHLIEADLADGLLGSGAQLAVHLDGQMVHSAAVGTSSPTTVMTDATLHNMWCATKPCVVVPALQMLWKAGLVEQPLSALLPTGIAEDLSPDMATATATEIASHGFGLSGITLFDAMMADSTTRDEFVADAIRNARRLTPTYGQWLPVKLLEFVVRTALDVELGDHVARWLAERSKHACEVRFSGVADDPQSIGPFVVQMKTGSAWSYHDRSPAVTSHDRLACGGYASMRGLSGFYAWLASPTPDSEDTAFVNWLLNSKPEQVEDEAGLGIPSLYQGGLLLGVPGYSSHEIWGHPGVMGSSFGFAVPQLRLGAAFMTNCFFWDTTDIDFFRSRVVRAIIETAEEIKESK